MNVSHRLYRAKEDFNKVSHREREFINSLQHLVKKRGNRVDPIRKEVKERICEMSFLVLFIGWETFLETTFENYLLAGGLKKTRRSRPKIVVDNIADAREILKGDQRRPFIDWANPETVRNRANIFFRNGEPYESAISNSLTHLQRMQNLRNHIAHHSRHSKEQFNKLVREIIPNNAPM